MCSDIHAGAYPKSIGTKLVLLRHGVTDWNASRRFQGATDIKLNDLGHAQAVRAAEQLVSYDFDAIYSSNLSRAVETARPLADRLGLPINLDPQLQEINVGTWEGLTVEEIDQFDPDFRPSLRASKDRRRSSEGETSEETGIRVSQALHRIADQEAGHTVLVVSHGLAIRTGLAHFMGWGMPLFWQLGDLDNCQWVTVGYQWSQWRLLEYCAGTKQPTE